MNKSLLSVVVIVAIVAVGVGIFSSHKAQQAKANYAQNMQTATVLPHGRDIADFALTDNKDQTYTNKNLLGHWTMFFFGFTNCGHICPTTMAELKGMDSLLQKEKIKVPQVVLVSVDPKRDTVKRLNAYVTGYNPSFMGLTGSQAKIDALAKDMNVLYLKIKPKKGEKNYDIDHSGTILLINPQGKLAALFSMPHKAKAMAHDFALIQKFS